MVGGGRFSYGGHRDICKKTQKCKVIFSAASAPDDSVAHSHCVRAHTCTCVNVRARTVRVRARCNRTRRAQLGSICVWCCVIFAATSRSITQYQHVQLQRHASTDALVRPRTSAYVRAWSYVRACGSACVHVRARAQSE